MIQKDMFGEALWVGKRDTDALEFSILYGRFNHTTAKRVKLRTIGLGFFRASVNGVCLNPEGYLPLSSDYQKRDVPKGEILHGHRIYVSEFDITDIVNRGENTLEIHFGGGWYTWDYNYYGLPKAIYSIIADDKQIAFSSENDLIGKSYVSDYMFREHPHEEHDRTRDLSAEIENAVIAEQIDTRYMFTPCPKDDRICELSFAKVRDVENGAVYDCGKNISGYPVIRIKSKAGEKICVRMGEELLPDGNIDPLYVHNQEFIVISDGNERIERAEFQWYGFRYIEIIGDAEPVCAAVVHADIAVTSSFKCDNVTLNWIYDTFVNTMLCNIHNGHPSDCPQIEKLGYTGDGQVTCHAAMSAIDVKETYRKWMEDISDCQDTLSGHVQYTAPYCLAGGGPGGWGSAIVEVPWQFYKHYGETEQLKKYYPQMLRFIDYLDDHSVGGVVTSCQDGIWCLGEWCAPATHSAFHTERKPQQIIMPPTYVNTYFKSRTLKTMAKIAEVIGKSEDIPMLNERAEAASNAMRAIFHDSFADNYFDSLHGANAFAVDIGQGGKLYENLVTYYKALGFLDTGIFGTNVVLKTLFSHGDAQLAVDLLTSDAPVSYEGWRRKGATTFWEYWPDTERSRSHSHPMFGSPVGYMFEYLLGIRQKSTDGGYKELLIEPCFVSQINELCGHMDLPLGRVEVSYVKKDEKAELSITVPKGIKAVFIYSDMARKLEAGKNTFTVNL